MAGIERVAETAALHATASEGFQAAMIWYWATMTTRRIIRLHLVLGGLPAEIWNRIAAFYGSNCYCSTVNVVLNRVGHLVFVLKNTCESSRKTFRSYQHNPAVLDDDDYVIMSDD